MITTVITTPGHGQPTPRPKADITVEYRGPSDVEVAVSTLDGQATILATTGEARDLFYELAAGLAAAGVLDLDIAILVTRHALDIPAGKEVAA